MTGTARPAIDALGDRAALRRIWSVLPEARLVGGVVRDMLADRPVADLDLATPDPPGTVIERLRADGIKVVPTGLAHGTVTAVLQGRPYEITTLRRDVETDGRHAVVAWTDDWQEDAARRDFTINAMSLGQDGTLHDYFGGAADLAAGRVRFVGEAARRIAEDALRILRYFRFRARYGTRTPDASAEQAIATATVLLDRLSAERVWSELRRLLQLDEAGPTLQAMQRLGVLDRVLPGSPAAARVLRLETLGAPPDPLLRLGALACLPGDPGTGSGPGAVAERLRLSNEDASRLQSLARLPAPHPGLDETALRRLLADEPADRLTARSWLAELDAPATDPAGWRDLRTRLAAMARPVFPLAGRDAVSAGLAPGPAVGEALRLVRDWWHDGGCVAGRDACLRRLADMMGAPPG